MTFTIYVITIHQTSDYSTLHSPDFNTEAYTDEKVAKNRLDELICGLESYSGVFYTMETIVLNKRNN